MRIYTIDYGGRHPQEFITLLFVGLGANNSLDVDRLASGWSLARANGLLPLPNPLNPIENGSETPTSGYPFIFPQFRSDDPIKQTRPILTWG